MVPTPEWIWLQIGYAALAKRLGGWPVPLVPCNQLWFLENGFEEIRVGGVIKIVVLVASTVIALIFAEGVVRIIDRYSVFPPRLVEAEWLAHGRLRGDAELAGQVGQLGQAAVSIGVPAGLEAGDILRWPLSASVSRQDRGPHPTASLVERANRLAAMPGGAAADMTFFNYVWNASFVNATYAAPAAIAGAGWIPFWYLIREPVAFFQFQDAPTQFPRYRYLPSAVYPTGLATNAIGWRGREAALAKPARVIRIAAVGASTTVEFHASRYTYPQLLEHWLNLWAERRNIDLRFEVFNAGREGVNSSDIRAIVEQEVLPLAPDYVIYYEGANQFDIPTVAQPPAGVTLGRPDDTSPPRLEPAWPRARQYSAIVQRLAASVDAARAAAYPPLAETVGKPPVRMDLPPLGVVLDREALGSRLHLNTILADLDAAAAAVRATGARFVMSSYRWMLEPGMVFPYRHHFTHGWYNRGMWPLSYADISQAIGFQNEVFRLWAQEQQVPFVDIARLLPAEPDLFIDTVHNSNTGIILKAWIYLNALLPQIEQDIAAGYVPVRQASALAVHPGSRHALVEMAPIKTLVIECTSPEDAVLVPSQSMTCVPTTTGDAAAISIAFRFGFRKEGEVDWTFLSEYVPRSGGTFAFDSPGRYEIAVLAREFWYPGPYQRIETRRVTVAGESGDAIRMTR